MIVSQKGAVIIFFRYIHNAPADEIQFSPMITRHELKYLIHHFDYVSLKHKLKHLLATDTHSIAQDYTVKSLYFDDIHNTAYHDKVDGVRDRAKYRIRQYNHDNAQVNLEKKIKQNDRVHKLSSSLTKAESLDLIQGKYDLSEKDSALVQEFKTLGKTRHFTPKVIVEYDREAYTFPINNIRITFDKRLRTHLYNTALFETAPGHSVLAPNTLILEIKYDMFLPGFIRTQFALDARPQLALSKYVMCRDGILQNQEE